MLALAKRALTADPDNPATSTMAVPFIQSSTRAVVRLTLKALPSFQHGLIDRVRTSLALETTPIHTYVPKATVEAVIGQLLSVASPSSFVNDVVATVQASSTGSSHRKADSVKTLLALAVVCSQ